MGAMWQVNIDRSKCVSCGVCVDICEPGVIDTDDQCAVPFSPEDCTGCLLCQENCPEEAIRVARVRRNV